MFSEPDILRIPAKSQRQAMDWSLVLVSQGIETTIQPPGEDTGWSLLVNSRDGQRALQSLRQYRVENRGWPWQQQWSLTGHHWTFDWGSVGWAAVMILFYWLSSIVPSFEAGGIMDSAKAVSGQWWRAFTAIFLHADLGHLATNLSIGIILLGFAMGRFGTGVGLLAAYLAGAGGNLLSLLLNAKPFHGLGASGMIMGALGLLAAQSFARSNKERPSLKYLLGGAVTGVMLFVLFGLTPGTDIAAHLGGFVSGLLLGTIILVFLPESFPQSSKANFASITLLSALVAMTWTLALRH